MAEYQADGRISAPATGKSIGTIVNWAGAAVSLALLFGVGVWGYKLVIRDVSGVPVVRAATGPMRVMPENPGGAPAQNQGLAVNKVAAEGVAEKPADRLILAPRPVGLTAEDSPTAKLNLIKLTPGSDVQDKTPSANPSVEVLADELTADTAPVDAKADPQNATQPEPVAEMAPESVADQLPKAGLRISLRPRQRPAGGRQVASVDPALTAEALGIDIDPATLPPGTRLAQLGAYESAEVARKEWDRMASRFTDFLEDKKRVIQKAESGGRVFYRLRAHGFADISEARRFCSALVAEKAECIPVTTK
ncbi:Sporulation related domain protein [Thalassovita gelatinovora]|uniref:Sporulation related domain protein n=2 Tax=Thalassovita gelatinovora TaxID=53501 RepID=A0A0N7LVL2_THAGE|nr:SPOR domain-containing protein [Thalassovita gelatinovora]CUH66610.1 Sporulation related domain protein [Thalassovita gelatinovora]SEQ38962.1 Sporulation related domain-containing protein [Thalassovita gelatinovora]